MNKSDVQHDFLEGTVLSTRMTLPLRVVGFALPVGFLVLVARIAADGTEWSICITATVGFLLSLLLGWVLISLATAQVGGNGLSIKRLGQKHAIPFASITSVRSRHFLTMFILTLPLVTVTYQTKDGISTVVRFVPPMVLTGWVCGIHPYVMSLRAIVADLHS